MTLTTPPAGQSHTLIAAGDAVLPRTPTRFTTKKQRKRRKNPRGKGRDRFCHHKGTKKTKQAAARGAPVHPSNRKGKATLSPARHSPPDTSDLGPGLLLRGAVRTPLPCVRKFSSRRGCHHNSPCFNGAAPGGAATQSKISNLKLFTPVNECHTIPANLIGAKTRSPAPDLGPAAIGGSYVIQFSPCRVCHFSPLCGALQPVSPAVP